MLKIALIGYGKMGKTIAQLAAEQGCEVVLQLNSATMATISNADLRQAQVAIEFTRPDAATTNILRCFEANLPVVCGTTGWHNALPQIAQTCQKLNGALLYATNFSLGVNIFFAINRQLAQLLNGKNYTPQITEIHHTEKLDAPSGTAITLANDIIANNPNLLEWVNHAATTENQLAILSERVADVKGTHIINWQSAVDTLSIAHYAHNRNGFALGALVAAKWLAGKQGIFTMNDVLGIH